MELWKISSSCIEELTLNANKKNIQLSLDGDPAADIKGNSKLIFEMVHNLVDNAIRYTEPGGRVNILVEPRAITVKETGGTGLGLAIVKHIAEVHKATIDLKSIVGSGTEIKVEF